MAVSLANEDVFLNWAKEQGRQYHTKAEVTKRQAIFMKNYNRMLEHNKEFAAGRVSWARGVNQWYDLTEEEWFAEMGFGESCSHLVRPLAGLLKTVLQECLRTRSRTRPPPPSHLGPTLQHRDLGTGGTSA